jgi:hypothetical protein
VMRILPPSSSLGIQPAPDHLVDVGEVPGNGGADGFQAGRSQGVTLGQVFDLTREFVVL